MDIKRYEAFVIAAETGSMSTAAKQLGYTPSGIIRLVNALEAEVGFPLLARRTTGVSPTAEGQRLLPYFTQIVQLEEQAQAASARIRGLAEGTLSIGALESIAAVWLPPVLRAYQRKYPGVNLNIITGSDAQLRRQLDAHEVDCCLFHDSSLKPNWVPLGRQEVVAWIPRSSHLCRYRAVILAELDGQPFIRIQPEAGGITNHLLAERNIEPDVRFTVNDCHTAYRMVSAGLGNALFFNGLSADWKGEVEEKPLSPEQYVEFGIGLPSMASMPPAVEEFVQIAKKHANTWPLVQHR